MKAPQSVNKQGSSQPQQKRAAPTARDSEPPRFGDLPRSPNDSFGIVVRCGNCRRDHRGGPGPASRFDAGAVGLAHRVHRSPPNPGQMVTRHSADRRMIIDAQEMCYSSDVVDMTIILLLFVGWYTKRRI